ncbi:hypothetical protein CC86DRAFT_377009 [Ophiobolus disseminans]|uniref:Uncharacterized protein n=1 Tax=Ophiobolus disseminans TaxID=1469910 RepID=A0A6A7ALV8_9PLEO|nr:hypothetical protein CC86DRAFT_377009 [Ophiobolus disseminans]
MGLLPGLAPPRALRCCDSDFDFAARGQLHANLFHHHHHHHHRYFDPKLYSAHSFKIDKYDLYWFLVFFFGGVAFLGGWGLLFLLRRKLKARRVNHVEEGIELDVMRAEGGDADACLARLRRRGLLRLNGREDPALHRHPGGGTPRRQQLDMLPQSSALHRVRLAYGLALEYDADTRHSCCRQPESRAIMSTAATLASPQPHVPDVRPMLAADAPQC